MRETGRRAGDGARRAAARRCGRNRFPFRSEVIGILYTRRRSLACIDHDLPAVGRAMEEKKSAAAKTRRIRLHDSKRCRHCDSRIECIPAALEYRFARCGRKRMCGCNRRCLLRRVRRSRPSRQDEHEDEHVHARMAHAADEVRTRRCK
jgi:hypothetical protein